MKTWFLQEPKNFDLVELSQLTLDATRTDSVKVKITTAEISPTDIETYLGLNPATKYPIVPTRTAIALISESNVEDFKKGQRVFLGAQKGDKLCGVDTNGYLSDYCIAPIPSIYSLPEGITDDQAIFIEEIAFALNCIETLDIEKTKYVALYGASSLNCILGQLILYYQAIPIIIDNDAERLEIAQNCGIYYTIDTTIEDTAQKIIEITGGKLADYGVFDSDNIEDAYRTLYLLGKRGRLCVTGIKKAPTVHEIEISKLIENELTLLSVTKAEGNIHSAINLLANKVLDVSELIKTKVDFNEAPELFEKLSSLPLNYKHIIKC